MEWTPGGVSGDIEDHRDSGGGGGGFGGGFGFGGLGLGGILIVGLLSLLFGRNFFTLFSGGGSNAPVVRRAPDPARTAGEQRLVEFVSFVLDDAQKTWTKILPAAENRPYRHAKLVLFRDVDHTSACGTAQATTGPFYCPEDEKVYLDLGFFSELSHRFGAPGEAAEAYVVAHELGHHVQKILGIEPKVQRLRESNPRLANPLSVKLELQADCFAGIWANSTTERKITNANDVRDALGAAAAVGDDRLQKMATGTVRRESFTHGSSAQRQHWFESGLDSGRLSACNTFGRS